MADDAQGGRFKRSTWEPDELEHTEMWVPDDEAPSELENDLPPNHLLLWLVVQVPLARRGTVLAIAPNAMFGRGRDATVRWDDERLSRRHARFTLEPDPQGSDDDTLYYFIWPQEARKPIQYNGTLLRGATRLHENDVLVMGDTEFVVKLLEPHP